MNAAVIPGLTFKQPSLTHVSNNVNNNITSIPRFQEVYSPQPTTEPNDPRQSRWFTAPDIHYIKNELTSGTSSLVSSIESIASTPLEVKTFLKSFSPSSKKEKRKVQSRDGELEWDRTPKKITLISQHIFSQY